MKKSLGNILLSSQASLEKSEELTINGKSKGRFPMSG